MGAPVEGAVARYGAGQRPLPVLAGFGAEWFPGAGTPSVQEMLAHGYYRGAAADPNDPQFTVQRCRKEENWPSVWDCNAPNVRLAAIYAGGMNLGTIGQLALLIEEGKVPPPPGFPPIPNRYGLNVSAPGSGTMMMASESNVGLVLGLGVAALALGAAVVVKKKRSKAS